MEYREFADVPKGISLLGMGNMRLPLRGENAEDIDEERAGGIIDLLYENGVNYFDTAYGYHNGQSEGFIGRALAKYPRESYLLATKMPMWNIRQKRDIPRLFEEQLRRTGAGYFDFYLCHSMTETYFATLVRTGLYDFLQEKKREGLIRHIGFSFHDTPEVLKKICAAYPWEFVQLQINYLDWELYRSREQYDIARAHGLPIVVMEPVRGGGLADLGPAANAVLQREQPGVSPAAWALRWVAGLPGVLTVLSGMHTLAQAQENLRTFSPMVPLNKAQAQALEAAKELYKENAIVPCTACQYCMPCPAGVDIPGSFALYKKTVFEEGGSMRDFTLAYAEYPEAKRGKNCVECGQCVPLCPQHIPIPERLAQLERGQKPG